MSSRIFMIIKSALGFSIAAAVTGCCYTTIQPPVASSRAATHIANPASANCISKESYDDPFAYCAAVGTINVPDSRYAGEKMPDSIVQGMIREGMISADAPLEFQRNAVWRCMNESVWVCHFGANLPCLEKADTAQTPTPAMTDFCKAHAAADIIPAAVTGRATVYQWGCNNGKAVVLKQLFRSDAQGYLSDFWYRLNP